MEGETGLPLQQLIASFDNKCLPKILQVISGVYFQGSIYELSGSEVCFCTGDLIKVINIELQSVCCEYISNKEAFELPISHTGLYKVVPEEMPYSTIEEMVSLRPVGLDSCLPFTFTSRSKMTLDNFTLAAGRELTVLSVEKDQVRCHVRGEQDVSAEVCIPLSFRGEFYECESEECFTLGEIMSSACLRSRKFRTTKCERPLILSPIYQVHAIMNLRKNVFKFSSSSEVDVIDVTEQCKDVAFVTPFSLTEVLSQPDESFPVVVEVLEYPQADSVFTCSWLPELSKSKHLVFHKKGTSDWILFSSLKSRKVQQYFLVSQQYGGRFRRRPREFNSVYELYVASVQAPGLRLSVTRSCEEVEEEGLPALTVGEQLEVMHCDTMELPCGSSKEQKQSVEALICHRLQEPDEGDDDDDDDDDDKRVQQKDKIEVISLPLYMQAHFMEVLSDNKKYRLRDLDKEFSFPLDVKIVNRDNEMETDPLVGHTCLKIEGAISEPIIQASFPHRPDHCFKIPTQWLSMSVSFTNDPLPWPSDQPPDCHVDRVTEVTDTFFYEYRKRGNSDAAPPPRPPKRNLSSSDTSRKSFKPPKKPTKADKSKLRQDESITTTDFANLTINRKKRPPAPPPPVIFEDQPPPLAPRKHSIDVTTSKALPNMYVKREVSIKTAVADVDSDHDYETVDDSLLTMMQESQNNVKFY
nr:PREDICTED: protein THEMIS2 [Paralichthys olivaceus]XP_019948308.1 PREDICTED: protein THEMIS2 [Paralichthys olivaceus]XP_019948309.1 PREDICTED: protein THEMIS2 [Paralichthys olivaceus]